MDFRALNIDRRGIIGEGGSSCALSPQAVFQRNGGEVPEAKARLELWGSGVAKNVSNTVQF